MTDNAEVDGLVIEMINFTPSFNLNALFFSLDA